MIYLDNSATTALRAGALEKIREATEKFANPSSVHAAGIEAKHLLEKSRGEIMAALGVRDEKSHRLIFTACGTESDNLAIFGTYLAKNFRFKPQYVTTDSEHPAVLEPLGRLSEMGKIDVHYLKTTGGKIDPSELASVLSERTVLVSIMAVNNETGAIYDLKSAFALTKRLAPNAVTHTDLTQGFLKMKPSAVSLGADMITISGHKIHAPKGVGALLVDEKVMKAKKLVPILLGGGQESGMRSGTENLIGIAALAGASKEGAEELDTYLSHAKELRAAFLNALDARIVVNEPERHADHIISITLPHVLSSHAVNALSLRGVCVSGGSACSSNGGHKSSTLLSYGLDEKAALSTLRVSTSIENTVEEMLLAAEAVNEVYAELLAVSGK